MDKNKYIDELEAIILDLAKSNAAAFDILEELGVNRFSKACPVCHCYEGRHKYECKLDNFVIEHKRKQEEQRRNMTAAKLTEGVVDRIIRRAESDAFDKELENVQVVVTPGKNPDRKGW